MTGTAAAPTVAIIGSGLAGLAMAIQLQKAGIHSFTIFEKSNRVGGTWRDNTYPGAACDVPSHLYSFSFEPKTDWSRVFPVGLALPATQRLLLTRPPGPHGFGIEKFEPQRVAGALPLNLPRQVREELLFDPPHDPADGRLRNPQGVRNLRLGAAFEDLFHDVERAQPNARAGLRTVLATAAPGPGAARTHPRLRARGARSICSQLRDDYTPRGRASILLFRDITGKGTPMLVGDWPRATTTGLLHNESYGHAKGTLRGWPRAIERARVHL